VRYRLLFDSSCAPCSNLARLIGNLHITDLQVAPLHDPEVRQAFERAGRPVPTEPALVDLDPARLRVWTGAALRIRLVRLIGLRRARAILGLLAAEAVARTERVAGGADRQPGRFRRRGILTATAAGIGAAVFGRAATASAAAPKESVTHLPPEIRERVLAAQPARQAVDAWGAIDSTSALLVVAEDGLRVAALPHAGNSAVTYVRADDLSGPGITLVVDPGRNSLRYHMTTGQPLVEQSIAADGTVRTANIADTGGAQPDNIRTFAICIGVCLGASIAQNCVNSCASCALGGLGAIVNCPLCAACAGVNGVRCAYDCRGNL
jgi:predicted DCC family thiol-disulfide oxidoreductase YuxK